MTTKMTGTMSANAFYEGMTFNNPGTRTITIPEDYPYYNEAMGVLSVLRRPVVQVKATGYINADGQSRRVYQYRVPNPIQYVINAASGLEVQDFQVALLQEGRNYPAVLPSGATAWVYEGMSGASTHVLRTEYQDANCLSNSILELDINGNNIQNPASSEFRPTYNTNPNTIYPTYLKLMLNLRRQKATATSQNVLLVLKYPVTIQWVNDFEDLPLRPCGVLPQTDAATVQSFCSSSTYAAAMNLRPGTTKPLTGPNTQLSTAPVITDVQVYPNPASGVATIRFSGVGTGRASAYLTDMVGRRVIAIMQDEAIVMGEQQKAFSISGLAPGLYQCVIETSGGARISTRLSVVR